MFGYEFVYVDFFVIFVDKRFFVFVSLSFKKILVYVVVNDFILFVFKIVIFCYLRDENNNNVYDFNVGDL